LSRNQISPIRGAGTIFKNKLFSMLRIILADEEWENNYNFSKINKKSRQRWLFLKIQEIFFEFEVLEDFTQTKMSKKVGFSVELDIFSFSHLNIKVNIIS